ncbi:MAG TPA: GNAT family N-acetyltransferase [Bacteroidales bacterium]|nr:GNAT family N-acetyltransferase [Bacteroidales bacterium]
MLKIRLAEQKDVPTILELIRAIADYEKLLDQVEATEEILNDSLFVQKGAEVLLGELDGKPIAFALFFHNFSTFTGKRGLYLEDIFVQPEYRNRGYGKQFFSELARIAKERDCGRMEWICLDWNEPSIQFYKNRIQAIPLDEWTVYRVTKDQFDHVIQVKNL